MNYFKTSSNRMRQVLLFTYLSLFSTLCIYESLHAQAGTIGSGTGSSYYLPVAPFAQFSYSQQIYTATELNEAGIFGPGNIQSIAFFCNTTNSATTNSNLINVFLGSTTQSTFASTSGWIPYSSLTNVGTWSLPTITSVDWMTFTLQTPFFWDGVSNVVIAMNENVLGSASFVSWRNFSGPAALGNEKLSLSYYSNYTNPDPNAPPTALYSSNTLRSQLRVSFNPSTEGCIIFSNSPTINVVNQSGPCYSQKLTVNTTFNNYQWKRDNISIPGAQSSTYQIPSDPNPGLHSYVCEAYCVANGQTITSNPIEVQTQNCFADFSSNINYMLVQNVTTTGINSSNQTAQIQFDLNWGYAWKDSINWDAAWIFMKYKNAAGVWKPCKVKTTGFDHGQGTPNNIQVPADQMGAFVGLSQQGNAHVDIQGMQLQWDYSGEGISNLGAVEVKVFAIEMVYIPQGDFNTFSKYQGLTMNAPGDNYLVVNNRLSPNISWIKSGSTSVGQTRVQGNIGIDLTANGSVESVDYPTGYTPFYMCKYEMSEQQYADFLNCLTTTQRSTLGVAGSSITSVNGVRYASAPNRACNGYALNRFLAYADWAGLRPMSILEYSKAALGPYKLPPASTSTASSSQEYVSVSATYPLGGNFQNSTTPKNVGEGDSNNSQAYNSGTGYYGVKDMGGNVTETVIGFSSSFSKLIHGNGVLATSGVHDVTNWNSLTEGSNVFEIEPNNYNGSSSNIYCWNTRGRGFRYARTAE